MVRAAATILIALAACTNPQPCPTPLEECGGQCVDVQSDPRHCGSCGTACRPGDVCAGGGCTSDPVAPCAARTGGAFVTLGSCDDAVKIWVRDSAFIDTAESRLGADPDPAFVASLALLAGPDCDAQWSWHVADLPASFAPESSIEPTLACSACPAAIQAEVTGAGLARRTWCPTGAKVLAVDPRSPLP